MKQKFSSLWLASVFILGCQSGPKSPDAGSSAQSVVAATNGYSILQGVTGPTWTRINLVRQKSEELQYAVFREDAVQGPLLPVKIATHEYAGSDRVIDEIEIKDLSAGTVYRFAVKDKAGQEKESRQFSTLEEKPSYNFAVVSCSDDFFKAEQKQMWDQLLARNPEFILSIGDNVYADRLDGKYFPINDGLSLWNRYLQTRQTLQLYHAKKLTPVVAIWDDHDYGKDGGDRRYPLKSESLKIFLSFFPQSTDNGNFARGPGAASRWTLGGQAFLMLDNRSFRSPNQAPPMCKVKPQTKACEKKPETELPDNMAKKEPETHFGLEQERWAFAEVRKLHRPVWLVSGDQWFGAYHPFESYEGNHPNSFRKFVREMGKSAYRVAFISGDRHSSELTKVPKKFLGYESFEIVSSPIHAKVYPSNWIEFPNVNQSFGTAEAMNYTMIRTNLEKAAWKIQTSNFKMNNVESFSGENTIWLNK